MELSFNIVCVHMSNQAQIVLFLFLFLIQWKQSSSQYIWGSNLSAAAVYYYADTGSESNITTQLLKSFNLSKQLNN